MNNISAIIFALVLLTAQAAAAGIDYNYINSNDFIKVLEKNKPVHVVDIQKKNNYLQKHFANSVATNAYPVKTAQEKNRIKDILSTLQANSDPVVIVGPRGTRASQKAYAYLLEQGVAPQRLAILEKGTRGWPAPQMLLNTSGQ